MSAERAAMRRVMFLSQDGVVLCTTLRALDELGILVPSLQEERSLADLCPDLTDAGFGALRVAAHCLHSTGWLAEPPALDPEHCVLRWTDAGRLAMGCRERYVAAGKFLASFDSTDDNAWARPWEPSQAGRLLELSELAEASWRLTAKLPAELVALIEAHLSGALAVPTMLWLHETGGLGESGPVLEQDLGRGMERLLAALGWLDAAGGWTPSGVQARAFALNFGGVATYLPLLARLPELYRGELTVTPNPAGGAAEWHVHRELNLRISAAAHRRYFADSEPIFAEIFDREPVEDQPRFIADMGCGEGSWLVHLHRLVAERTRRGKRLDSDPLIMVGIDPDAGALEQARRNLDAAGVPALLIAGDVTDPDGLQAGLAEHGLAIEDGLHIRAFIDHERTYLGDDPEIEVPGWSSGTYMDMAGAPLSGEEIERDLVAHLRRWRRHVGRHGMVVLEAHNVAPGVVARNLGALHGIAFDAHQAYSKQYPVDHPAFVRCCQAAGLGAAGRWEHRYPSSRPFVAVSLNRLFVAETESPLPGTERRGALRADTWRPGPDVDLEDGQALHEILFQDGDIRFPAPWCSIPTGFVVAATLAAIEARLEQVGEGDAIRVLDYGAGTGTATIELLKACRERGIEQRLARAGVELELHLADIPAGWFAQGHELLRECAWTRFHSLRAKGGGFRPLREVTGGATMDAVMANMVFHLIPPKALERTVDELASVLAPGGRLLWSSPDLGPPGPGSVLLHDPNRALRERWLERLDREGFDEKARRRAQERAERRILPQPLAADVVAALERRFAGEPELGAYEMLGEDIVRGLLVPSNQAEYLAEIEDREERERTIRELMLEEVIPTLQESGAGTSLGLNLHWTMGAFAKRD